MAAKKKRVAKRSNKKPGGGDSRHAPPIVVYIHGIGEQPPRDRLMREWDLATFGRNMSSERRRLAYWSDLLHGDPTRRRARAAARDSDTLDPTALLAQAGVDPKDPDALRFVEELAFTIARANLEPTGSSTAPRRTRVLPLPGFLRRPIAKWFLQWLVKDAAAYFFDSPKRRLIQQRLVDELPTDGTPIVLVAHSLGTVIAYEVLHDLAARGVELDVLRLITLGSPLGLREVQDALRGPGAEPLRVPPNVRSWSNFADRFDPVALDASLASDYEPNLGVRIHDRIVLNERTTDIAQFNPHSSVGYLANATIRRAIHEQFGFDSESRFLVARDVAARMTDGIERQSVLIEVLHPEYWALGESEAAMLEREAREVSALGATPTLSSRIDQLAIELGGHVAERAGKRGDSVSAAVADARIIPLRKYVSAQLRTDDIVWLADNHSELHVYAMWRSAEKRKLIHRSLGPIKVDAAFASYRADGADVTWAVLDTGIRWDHPHFATHDTILEVLDCTTSDARPKLMWSRKDGAVDGAKHGRRGDPDGHGTHVAGIIAGENPPPNGSAGAGSDPRRFRGMAPKAKLLVYKVLDDEGSGEDAWIIKAIDDIYRRNTDGMGIQVHGVNLSLGGPFDPTVYGCGYSPICKELRDLWRIGVVVCVAAGNEGRISVLTGEGDLDLNTQVSVGDPANLDDCIAVGSVNADKPHLYGVSHFSSRGPTADGRPKPDVVAPGERIDSCDADFRKRGTKFEALYRQDSGTSMACPHVSGLLAAFLSVRREFRGRPDEVKRILMANCNDLGRDRYHQGAGMPNLMKMLLNT